VNTDVSTSYWDFITDDTTANEVRVSGNKVWHAGNFDPNSKAPSGYGLGTAALLLTNGTDINTIKVTGFYRVNAAVNAPPRVTGDNPGIWHYIEVIQHDTTWVVQNAWEYSTGSMFTRALNNGIWTAWRKVWTDANDGAGSGLDADLLDGLDSTKFLRSDVTSTIVGNFYINNHGYGGVPSIALAVGDTDTGLHSTTDGNLQIYSNNVSAATIYNNSFNITSTTLQHNGNTIWDAGNDGAGSGLDADLLDGLDSSVFYQRQTTQIVSGSDWNTFQSPGTYKVQGAVNTDNGAPLFGYGYGLLLVDRAINDSENRINQTYIPHMTDQNIYMRMYNSTSWTTWRSMPYTVSGGRTVWHSDNDGAGSGLDADLLDGYQYSAVVNNARAATGSAFMVETRTTDPASPTIGQMWLRTDL
jgi:hypothetical protein